MNNSFPTLQLPLLTLLLLPLAGCTSSREAQTALAPTTATSPARGTTPAGAGARSPLSPLLQTALLSSAPPQIASRQLEKLAREQRTAALWAKFVLRDIAPPVESGPGVVVCEPVAGTSAPDLAAFGSGCTRWLHLAVAGQGELGKTPLWGAMDEARREVTSSPSTTWGCSTTTT